MDKVLVLAVIGKNTYLGTAFNRKLADKQDYGLYISKTVCQ